MFLSLLSTLSVCAGPRLTVEPALWDFGVLTNRLELTHDFLVRNEGDSVLMLTRVASSCEACLAASADKTSLASGDSGLVHCQLDLHRLRGSVSRTVSIYSNDPDKPLVQLGIVGVVAPNFEVTPSELSLDLTEAPSVAVARILPQVHLQAPLSRVQIDKTNMTAQLNSDGSGGTVLTVQASGPLPVGRTAFNVTVLTSDSNDPPCSIQGTVNHPPDVEVIPAVLQLRAQAAPQRRILWIRQHGSEPLALMDVVAPSERLQSTVEPDPSGYNYRVYVTATEQSGFGGTTNLLIFKMRDRFNHEHRIEVPITFTGSSATDQ
jgi:hypothetical protein